MPALCERTVVSSVSSPEGIAVDWATKKIYWTDGGHNVIEVAEFDGSHRLTLFYNDIYDPRAIVVDPFHGYVKVFLLLLFTIEFYILDRIKWNLKPLPPRVFNQKTILNNDGKSFPTFW